GRCGVLRHAIDAAAEVGDLVAARADARADARLEAPGGGGVERPAQAPDRPCEVPGEERAEGEARGDADGDQLPEGERRLVWAHAGRQGREEEEALAVRRGDEPRAGLAALGDATR